MKKEIKIDRNKYIERICAMSMNIYESKVEAEKRFENLLDKMKSDGIDFNNKYFK